MALNELRAFFISKSSVMPLYLHQFIQDLEKILETSLDRYEDSITPSEIEINGASVKYAIIIQSILEGEYYLHASDPVIVDLPAIAQRAEIHLKSLTSKTSKLAKLHKPTLRNYLTTIGLFYEVTQLGMATLTTIVKVPRINFLIELKRQDLLRIGTGSAEDKNPYINLLRIGVSLAVIDMSLSCSSETIDELRSIIDYLNRNESTIINPEIRYQREILAEKAEYLLAKIDIRINRNSFGDLPETLKWMEKRNSMKHFADFMTQSIKHYLPVSNKHFADYCSSFQGANLVSIHAKSKALRKGIVLEQSLAGDLERLKTDLTHIITTDSRTDFNEIAYDSISYLLANTELVIQLRGTNKVDEVAYDLANDKGEKQLHEIFAKIERLHTKTNEFDYYLYYQFLLFLNKLIDHLRDHPLKLLSKDWKKIETEKEKNDELKEVVNRIAIIEELYTLSYKRFNEYIQKWEHRTCSPVYMAANECITGGKLFLDSSYILPTDFEFVKGTLSGALGRLSGSLRSLKNRVGIELNSELFENKYKKELDSRDFKAITVLALFISVASFILGTVKIMEGRDIYTSQSIMLTFGTGLLMFNLIIYWLSNHSERLTLGDIFKGKLPKIITLRSSAVFGLLILFLALINYRTNDYKYLADKRIDSLKNKTKRDSVIIDSLKISTKESAEAVEHLKTRLSTIESKLK